MGLSQCGKHAGAKRSRLPGRRGQGADLEKFSTRGTIAGAERLRRAQEKGEVSGNAGRRCAWGGGPQKKCPREAGSFGVGAYAQTCCASLQGGRQRSRICKCAIAKNGSEGIHRSGAPAVLRISVTNRRRGRFFLSGGISRGVSRRLPPGVVVRKRQRRITVRRWRDAAASASLCFSEIVSLIAHADAVRLLSVRHRRPSAHGESGRHNHGGKRRERNF